ncbi:MAG: uracil-DNA glycosylase family protein [Verrucomicrobiia bacterium]
MRGSLLELLDATIGHLEQLRAEGTKWVSVSPETLASLSTPAQRRGRQPRSSAASPAPLVSPEPFAAPDSNPTLSAAAPPPASTPVARTETAPFADRAAGLAVLRERVLPCAKCPHLARARKNVVFGVGNPEAALMFVGEAPGADEDTRGEPFVGAAGQLLTKIIKGMGYSREDVYIANILKCRPDTPGQTSGNRKPTSEEMRTCLPYLLEQIRIVQPKVIVALGATAMEGLFGKTVAISRMRGHWQSFGETPVMPTYHPSYLLRNQARTVKREVWEDMLQVLERLGAPISQKQRDYFK